MRDLSFINVKNGGKNVVEFAVNLGMQNSS
jgi:hypothetical protein